MGTGAAGLRRLTAWLAALALAACGSGGGDDTPPPSAPPAPSPPPVTGWPTGDGAFGAPASTFTLPATLAGKITADSIYLADVQATFPQVDWATLDRLYIPAGHYRFIHIGNLPVRSAGRRLVITNTGGQVRVGALGHHYLFNLAGGANWVLTGRYDPVSKTGDAGYPGHRGGQFAHTQGRYGIVVDDAFTSSGVSGLAVRGGATDFEIEFVEIARVEFAGIMAKTDSTAQATMSNVALHDNYIHDTGSEGLYIGSTQAQPQHQIRNWRIHNNRILRTGTEAIQLGQLGGTNEVHHNVFGPAAIDWRAAFQDYQDNNFQIGIREGELRVHDNIFIGSAGSTVSLFAQAVNGDATAGNVGIAFSRNYFSDMRNLGMYVNNVALPGMNYRFENNVWRAWRFERNQVYAGDTAPGHLLRVANTTTPVSFSGDTWSHPTGFINVLAGGSGTSGNVSGSGNMRTEVEAVRFVDAGLPDGFDYLTLEMWTDVATRGGNAPVSYAQGFLVMHNGAPYRCRLSPCPAGVVPEGNPATWEALAPFADDVRVVPGSRFEGRGLVPQ
jgi:hypothetical protein